MKARVAMFQQGLHSEWRTAVSQPRCAEGNDAWTMGDYTRVTEWVDVEFQPLPPEQLVPAQLSALDREAEAVRKEFTDKLHEIAERRASLLALTHMPDSGTVPESP